MKNDRLLHLHIDELVCVKTTAGVKKLTVIFAANHHIYTNQDINMLLGAISTLNFKDLGIQHRVASTQLGKLELRNHLSLLCKNRLTSALKSTKCTY